VKEQEIRPQQLFNRYLELSRQDVARYFADPSRFVLVPCPACGCAQQEAGLAKLGFIYVTCADCGSLYVSPRPCREAIDDYYRRGEAVKFWSTDFFRETAEARREKIFRPRAQLVANWASSSSSPESRRVFADVGSGYGIFLEEVARLGCFDEVVGIEPAPNLAEVCRRRGFRILEKPAETVAPEELRASFVSSFELLEHLYQPACFLAAIRDLLNPGGLLLFTTLTISGFDLQVLWENSKSIHPPHHLNLISVDGMERLLLGCGFELVELRTPGELDVDIVRNMLQENPNIPVSRFARSIALNPREEVRTSFQGFLKANRLSSHIRVVARRPLNGATTS
jgi:SAM-dependent methyltransferase/ribosomal protein S27E